MACPRRCRPKPSAATCSTSTRPARWSARCIARPSAISTPGAEIMLIGHAGHPEVIGTMGQLPAGAVTLVETVEDARRCELARSRAELAYITQTTLSVDDTARHRRRAAGALPAHRTGRKQRRHLLRHDQPAGGGQGDRARAATRCWWSARPIRRTRMRLVEVARARRLPARRCWCSAPRDIDWRVLEGVALARHHRRRLGARDPGRGGDRRLPPRASTSTIEEVVGDARGT